MTLSCVQVGRGQRAGAPEAAPAPAPTRHRRGPRIFGACASIRSAATAAFAPVSRIAARRNAAFLRFDFDQREVPLRLRSFDGDRHDQARKAGAAAEIDPFAERRRVLQELQAVGDVPRPDIVQRRAARRDCASAAIRAAARRSARDRPRISGVTKPNRSSARGLDRRPHAAPRPAASGLRLTWLRSRVSAAGVTPSMRPAWPRFRRPHGGELLPDLGREPGDRPIVEVRRQLERLVAPHRLDVRLLALQIDGILRVDRRPARRSAAGSRRAPARSPQAARSSTSGIGEQLEGAAANAVLVHREAVPRRLRRRQRQRIAARRARSLERRRLAPQTPLPAPLPTQPASTPSGVSRWSALSARSDRRYSAREVNMR